MQRFVLSFFSILSIFYVFGWGQKGHDTVAYIAEQHLTPAAQQAVDSILDGRSLVYWSNWLDNASHTPEYAYTSTWHYKNVDADVSYEDAPVNPAGDIINALNAQTQILTSVALDSDEAALALKILVHLMGDLHQPMHMGHQSDRGGNNVTVIYFRHDYNLHSIWDTQILESGHKWSYTEWQQQIDRISEAQQDQIIAGWYDNWGRETCGVATMVYDNTPTNDNLSYDYVAQWTPVIEDQLEKGGLRLAHVLNTIFDEEYSAKSLDEK